MLEILIYGMDVELKLREIFLSNWIETMTVSSDIQMHQQPSGVSRLKLFLALSRTPHGVLDIATPAFAALLCLGAFPSVWVVLLGLLTAFAGYTAVYALNDVVDFSSDRAKFAAGNLADAGGDLDAVMVRHPMAQGMLGYHEGMAWVAGWGAVAFAGAWLLNPTCAWIFLGGCVLEAAYCRLWRVSPFRTAVSGCVKTLGAVAAVFAVDASPSPLFLMVLFLCLFLWEIGGQNVPNDWMDVEEDRKYGGRTIPVCFGIAFTRLIIVLTLSLAVVLSGLLFGVSPGGFGPLHLVAVLCIGGWLLLLPAVRLYRTPRPAGAADLFNRASWFPPALLGVALAGVLF